MSILESIKNAIFGGSTPAAPLPGAVPPPTGATTLPGTVPPVGVTPTVPPAPVDVYAVLAGLAAKNPQALNWRSSIVDLMKLLGLDSSVQNRQALAKELGYTGDTSDTATMNVWLYKQVMTHLASSGGKVPSELLR